MTDRLAELGALQYAVENLSTAGTNPNRLGLAGYIHAAYTDYQTWAAANPGVNPNRLSARGRIYGYFYDNASWSPSSLFANSEVGAWYDPSDLSTMFQDSAGTTPVTADGQPVGKILDKSGRGNHASQATAASRPLYKTDGTYHWLQFDGVDDSLSTAAIDFTSTDKMSVFSGINRAVSGNSYVFMVGINEVVAGSFGMAAEYNQPGKLSISANGGSNGSSVSDYDYPTVTPFVVASSIDLRMPNSRLAVTKVNGALRGYTGSDITAGAGNFGNLALTVGSMGSLSYRLTGNIYSLIVRGALSTTQEITDTETWVNSKCGAF